MVDAPNALASDADHPVPPSRLLSKHRPRRRAAALARPCHHLRRQRPLCHCCGVRFPTPQPGTRPKRRPVRPLSSLWRVVLLCTECLSLVRSAAVCSYCLSLDNLPPEDSAVVCRHCKRCVHRSCISAEHRTTVIQPVDVEDFLCVDCCPTVRSKNGGFNLGLNLETCFWDRTSVAGENSLRKAAEVKMASKRGNNAVGSSGLVGRNSGVPVLLDEELALQLHLAMNGSQRISRSGNSSGGGSAETGKGKNDGVCGRICNINQEICVTNMMAQLDEEEEPGCNRVLKCLRSSDSSVTVVLALECVKGKHTEESMKAKRKGPHVITQQDDLVDPYKKKYSKRSSSKLAKDEYVASRNMCDGLDIDADHGGNGVAPMK
ncbi:hypothetical protein BDA96_10G187600 [Sorghum bicolor]|uniref:Uncharacterized protein n=1 Tax=Sorghum bicolor TaxID=4558 RepID=A0A921U164_SORBI|nr:hypothetical protein BDA96_10G187600 [Sorghum bicolor]